LNVPILDVPALGTQMSPDRKRLPNDLATVEAPLRSEVRWHFDDSRSGALSLECEDILERGPTCIGDGLCKVVVLEHVLGSKIFDGDKGVAVDVASRRLVSVVLTLTGYSEVLFRLLSCHLLAAVGALLSPCRLALCSAKLFRRPLPTVRVLDRVSVGVRDEVGEPNVETDPGAVSLFGRIAHIADDEHVPVSVGAVDEVRRLGSPFERAMLFDLEATPELLRDSQLASVGINVHVPPAPVLSELDRVPAVRHFEAREPDLPSELFAAKETLERLVESVGEGLHRGLGNVLRARATATPLEPMRKVVTGQELARLIVMSPDHLKHLVVKSAALRQSRKKQTMLFAVGVKSILERLMHSLVLADVVTPHNGFSPGRPKVTALKLTSL
jgi:hypothetical protein